MNRADLLTQAKRLMADRLRAMAAACKAPRYSTLERAHQDHVRAVSDELAQLRTRLGY